MRLVVDSNVLVSALLSAKAAPAAKLPVVSSSRDPNDTVILATAIAGRADALVSEDNHLLALGAVEGVPSITAREVPRASPTAHRPPFVTSPCPRARRAPCAG